MEFNQATAESFLAKLTETIEDNVGNEHFGVSELARELGMSRSNLFRKVKVLTNCSVSQYIREIRLQTALELLRKSSRTISEVAMESGFGSLPYFTKCFRDYYGVPPSRYNNITETPPESDNIDDLTSRKEKSPANAKNLWIVIAFMTIAVAILLILNTDRTSSIHISNVKSVAVIPNYRGFPDREDAFLIDYLMNEIRYDLSQIEDLKVASRISVERYRNSDISYREIGEDLQVNFILVCSTDTIQERTLIRFNLIDTRNRMNLWSEPLVRVISLDNILSVKKEVAFRVSSDLKAVVELEEIEQIERNPTEILAALNYYMLGWDYIRIHDYSTDAKSASEATFKAKYHFEQAIDLDSAYADAYASLGYIYINDLYYLLYSRDIDKARIYLDTGLVLLEKALHHDSVNQLALNQKAVYYDRIGLHQDAKRIYEQLPENREHNYLYYQNETMRYFRIEDYYSTLENYQKYIRLKPEDIIIPPHLLRAVRMIYLWTGYPDLEEKISEQLLEFNLDTLDYLSTRIYSEVYQEDFEAALKYAKKIISMYPTIGSGYWYTAACYVYLGDFSHALEYLVLSEDLTKQSGEKVRPRYISGYIYQMNGNESMANYHFQGEIATRIKEIEYSLPLAQQCESHFWLASIYMALGDEEKALGFLKNLKLLRANDYAYINSLASWPGWESIRDRPEFLDIQDHLEEKYQKQHKLIGKLIKDLEKGRS